MRWQKPLHRLRRAGGVVVVDWLFLSTKLIPPLRQRGGSGTEPGRWYAASCIPRRSPLAGRCWARPSLTR